MDILWNYSANLLKSFSTFIILPLILRKLNSDEFALYTIFASIYGFIFLLDFGFIQSFSRNLCYAYSGVKEIKEKGVGLTSNNINNNLVYIIVNSMKIFYNRLSLIVLVIQIIFGSIYILVISNKTRINHIEIIISWVFVILTNTYEIYTSYYQSIFIAENKLKLYNKIYIFGQLIFLILNIIFYYFYYNLVLIILFQFIALLIVRNIAFYYSKKFTNFCSTNSLNTKGTIIDKISPNAYKNGITNIGAFLVKNISIFLGAIYLPLEQISSLSLSIRVFNFGLIFTSIYNNTYYNRIIRNNVNKNYKTVLKYFRNSLILNLLFHLFIGYLVIFFGDQLLKLLKSNTNFSSFNILAFIFLFYYLESNSSIVGFYISTFNEIPYYKNAIVSGIITVIIQIFFLKYTNLGVLSLVIAPLLAQIYNYIKWPLYLIKKFKV